MVATGTSTRVWRKLLIFNSRKLLGITGFYCRGYIAQSIWLQRIIVRQSVHVNFWFFFSFLATVWKYRSVVQNWCQCAWYIRICHKIAIALTLNSCLTYLVATVNSAATGSRMLLNFNTYWIYPILVNANNFNNYWTYPVLGNFPVDNI